MPPHHRLSSNPDSSPSEPPTGSLTVEQLAHELNSLLDGSIRSVGLALRSLRGAPATEPANDSTFERLETARSAMMQMADLLARVLRGGGSAAWSSDEPVNLTSAIERAVRAVEPLAEELGVRLRTTVAPDVSDLPAGPLQPVIMNGLRNALQACAARPGAEHHVELVATMADRGQIRLLISDSGVGLDRAANQEGGRKPGGHGIGLRLCQQIVAALEGSMRLVNVPFDKGAVLEINIPVGALTGAGTG